jgi:HK97 family phage portal protein
MRIGPFEIRRTKTASAAIGDGITHLPGPTAWWPVIRESFAGAWQRGITVPIEDAMAHPTYWACVTLIAGDIAKIRPKLVEEIDGIDVEVERASPYAAVLDRPNHYQNRIQFFTYWMLSKLMRGNTYALKARDNRGLVTSLYLLDPLRVRPLVSPSGEVYYACQQDLLAELTEASLVIPAREIIHDIGFAPYHPLCGFSPVYACGHPAIQALTINRNATRLFNGGFQLGGILSAPGQISETTANRLEKYWQENYSGADNTGKIAVVGDGMKFDKPTVMSAVDAQVIDQLKWNDEKICAVHHVPPYKVGVGPLPSYNNVEALGQQYYGDCLQYYFESIELCLTEGLEQADAGYETEFCIEELDRMDSVQRMDVATKGVIGGVFKPDEARAKFNLPPVKGGDKVYLQRQNWPLEVLGSDVVSGAATEAKPGTLPTAIPAAPPAGMPTPDATPPAPPAPTKAIDKAALMLRVAQKMGWAA